ncbi:hypothetical protein DZ860_03290 [Vibrio sinensis]|uniref:Uncharacterized protein n=1 Tax=Vibrio sinensis TaxID=2302434 RepID=A0A3A6QTL5_9VIBR|nr:hypothetical protein [Vibrio sinensis]RJX75713.1 hypothetical protein DZ860_03290 [Vibrio sinensis]
MAKSIEELAAAIRVADEFWNHYTNGDKTTARFHLFRAIIELVNGSAAFEAQQLDECYVTSSELADKVAFLANAKPATYNSGRLNQEYKLLLERLDALQPSLEQAAKKLGLDVIPVIHKEANAGGQGKQSIYRLLATKVNTSELNIKSSAEEQSASSDPNKISYYIESLPKLPVWTRWLQNINMTKHRWKMVLFTMSPIVLIIICAIIFQLSSFKLIEPQILTYLTVFTMWYVGLFLLCFRYLIDALNNNITTLPEMMLPLNLRSAVLQYELNEPGSDNGRIKQLTIKVFAAKCPICGYRVDIKSVGLPFRTRLIGVCNNNPIEHRYTFDFTTQQGTKLS